MSSTNLGSLRRVDRNKWERHIRELDPAVLAQDVKGSREAGGRTKGVALMLATYARPDGTNIYPGVTRLGAAIGLSERQTRFHLERLRTAGLIRKTSRGSNLGTRNAADRYELTLPSTQPGGTGGASPEDATKRWRSDARLIGGPAPTNTGVNTGVTPLPPSPSPEDCSVDHLPGLPTSVVRAWKRAGIPAEDHANLWQRVRADPDTRDPQRRALNSTWIGSEREHLAAARKEERARARAKLERGEPECFHGVAAGRAPAPHDDLPICPDCRRDGREPELRRGRPRDKPGPHSGKEGTLR